MQEDNQQVIIEHQLVITDRDNQIQAIKYEDVVLQAQQNIYQTQLQRCQNQLHDISFNCNVPRANDPGKDNIVMLIEKKTTPEEEEFYEYPYYIARIQTVYYHKKMMVWSTVSTRFKVEELEYTNSILAFN